MGITSLVGNWLGAESQEDAATEQARASQSTAAADIAFKREMLNKMLAIQQPYNEAGVSALGKLQGTTNKYVGDGNIVRGVPAVDPTGGAGQYSDAIAGMEAPTLPQLSNLPDLNIGNFGYKLDPNDPAYQFKLSESEKAINAAAAARGNYNSRAAINEISDASRAIAADEVSAQFNRAKDIYGMNAQTALAEYNADYGRTMDQFGADTTRAKSLYDIEYGKNTDLFNMSSVLGNTDYNRLLDLVKIGQGSASAAGGGAVATGQGVTSTYANLANNLNAAISTGANARTDFYTGLGNQPTNAWAMYNASSGGTPWYSYMGGGGGYGGNNVSYGNMTGLNYGY